MQPMLAHPIPSTKVIDLIQSDDWAAEQKLDGHRALIDLTTGTPYTRTGKRFDRLVKVSQLLSELHQHRDGTPGAWFDGEFLPGQEELWLFDFIIEGADHSYDQRRALLDTYSDVNFVVPSYTEWADKARLTQELLATNREGVMFKRRSSLYRSRRSNNWLKYKFTNTCDCVVTALNLDGRDNMELSLFFGDDLRTVAECSALTGDGPNVKIGDVVEVTYLYATDGHRLYQPVTPRIRTDKHHTDCTSDQLIYTNKSVLDIL